MPPPTTPHPPSSSKSLLSTTPTETLRSSALTKRISIVSDFESDDSNPDGRKDGRIEEWLEQHCGGFITWENEEEKQNMFSKERFLAPLRHKESSRTLLTTNSVTTRTTSTCFSSESDPLFPSSTAASSVTGPSPSNQPPCELYTPTPRPRSDDPEVARADSPLLGFTVNEITAADATHTCSFVANTDGKNTHSGMDVDKVTDGFFLGSNRIY